MGRATVLLLLSALLALSSGPVALAEELDLDHVKELRDKGKEHFDKAANVDLSHSDRNKERKTAYQYLTEAFNILDRWCDEHPADGERFEDLMVEIHKMRYWLRKESPMGLLDEDDSNVRKGKPPDWPDRDQVRERVGARPGGDPSAAQPAPAAQPAQPQVDPIEEHLKHARDYESAHPYDLAGIRDLYLDILEHAKEGSPEYETCMQKVSHYNAQLKEAYRLLRDEDPDTLKESGAEERRLVHSLSKDLDSKEPDVRRRAAQYMGLLGSGEAARHLVKKLKREKDPAVQETILEALVKIGGSKVTDEVGGLRTARDEDLQRSALDVLLEVAKRSSVDARYASAAIGKFVLSKDDVIANAALGTLEGMGQIGVYGLGEAAQVKDHERRVRVIRSLGETGDGRAAGYLGPYLIFGAKGRLNDYQEAAKAAILKIGKPTVPYLARFLGNPRLRQWTKYLLRELTGKSFKSEEGVKSWWERQKK